MSNQGGSRNPAELRVAQLSRFAYDAMRAGRVEEAARMWQQVLDLAPGHPQALFHLGIYALSRKDAARARQLLGQAANADPNAPGIAVNLSYAFRDLGDVENEMAAITRALVIDPYYFPALLAKGMLIERGGNVRAAAKAYGRMLPYLPPDDDIPPNLKDAVGHARQIVRESTAALAAHLETRLADVRARHASADLSRFEECKDIALGNKKVYVPKPAMLLVPQLPAIPFYDRAQFPWLEKLESATDAMREELRQVLHTGEGFRPYVTRAEGMPLDAFKDLNNSPDWSAYFFWKDAKRFEEACARCPRTAAAIDAVPLMHATNFGPTVMFSVLAPRTHLPAHSSATNARLIVHLPIIVPGNCRFRVGNTTRDWREGEAWVFDDTIDHEAWNDSDQTRVIMLLDVWNPALTMAERELVTTLLNGMNEYYSG
jgi:aspartyl/asparaginyl beta-hydroxylase (cupin superfamily)